MNTIFNLEETESKRVDSYANKYNFLNLPPNFVFQWTMPIERFDRLEDKYKRGEILLHIKGGDRS